MCHCSQYIGRMQIYRLTFVAQVGARRSQVFPPAVQDNRASSQGIDGRTDGQAPRNWGLQPGK